jgi:putative inorganic carbon (HCO3(-)) transporter
MLSSTAAHDKKGQSWLYGAALVFAVMASVALANEFYYIFLLPVAMLVVVAGLYRLDLLMFFTVIVTPFSINLAKTGLGIGVSLPSEPLIFGIMLVYLAKVIYDGGIDRKVLYHPVSLAIIFHLLWMTVTTLTSSMPVVSFKATLAIYCFVLVYFYFGTQVFRKFNNIMAFAWCYMIPLIFVIGYTIFMHSLSGFTVKAAHTAMVPFYNDHTSYAAMIALFIPLVFGMLFDPDSTNSKRAMAFGVLAIFITAIVLSYTRASWVSLVAALLCYLVFLLKIRTWVVVSGIAGVVVFYLAFQTQITMALEGNQEESSTNYAEHVQSVSNITTDASNVERLNRWASAFRMFDEKPFFGWGPGTYMFQYAPFQKWNERTIISTNFGEGGNAHSEYIGPLAEQGVLGSVAFILIGAVVIYRASRLIILSDDKRVKLVAKGLILGLITYWVHGMLNNFLDTEKASVPFWGFIGALVALEVYHFKGDESNRRNVIREDAGSKK